MFDLNLAQIHGIPEQVPAKLCGWTAFALNESMS